jgi:hypothetical protein
MKASTKKGEVLKKRTKPTQQIVKAPAVSETQHRVWESYRDRQKLAKPATIEGGQIWSTLVKPNNLKGIKLPSSLVPRLVMVLNANGEVLVHGDRQYRKILVAPISPNLEMASRWDFVVEQEASPLGYSFMVEVWNKTTILADSLNQFLGLINEGLLDLIERLNMDHVKSAIENLEGDWEIYGKSVGTREVKPGNEVYYFQRIESEELEYLDLPLRLLATSPALQTQEEDVVASLKVKISQRNQDSEYDDKYRGWPDAQWWEVAQ